MKRLPVLMIAVLMLSSAVLKAQSKIGYVDSKKIRDNYEAVRDAEKSLTEENRKWEEELTQMNQDLDKLSKEMETYSLILSDALKKEREDEIAELKKDIQAFQKRIWGDGGEYFTKQEQLFKPVYEAIKAIIDEVAEDKGLDIVFDSIEGNILFAKDNMNITEDVIEELRRRGGQKKTGTGSQQGRTR